MTSTARNPLVYVVDDDDALRDALRFLLESAGYRAETYAEAEQFLAVPRLAPGSCIILDVRMPKLSGLDVQRLLTERGVECSLILITGHPDIDVVVRAMRAGAVQVFGKPVEPQAFIEAVQHAIVETGRRREIGDLTRVLQERFETLTAREREVLDLVVAGQPNKIVADTLGMSEQTVKAHRGRVMQKMGAASLPDLVRMADRLKGLDVTIKSHY